MNRKDQSGVSHRWTRRGLLKGAAGAAGAAGLVISQGCRKTKEPPKPPPSKLTGKVVKPTATKGRINQSVCKWCWDDIPLEKLARECAAMGVKSLELVPPKDWPILKKYGLICALTGSHMFVDAWTEKKHHAMCIEKITKAVDATSAAGWPNVITFSGSRRDMTDEVGIKNTVEGLKKVIGHAEKKKVNLCFEVLNSRVAVEMKGHPGYMADKVEWAAEVCDKVGSERLKILFDIYHVQIMQGDVITRIKKYAKYIGHYHVAGVPGRNEIAVRFRSPVACAAERAAGHPYPVPYSHALTLSPGKRYSNDRTDTPYFHAYPHTWPLADAIRPHY